MKNLISDPQLSATVTLLTALGEQIRLQRKSLRISAVAAAEAAGLSRVTLHRIEKGSPAVTMGAYVEVMQVLGLAMAVQPQQLLQAAALAAPVDRQGWIPARIVLADYPQLKQLAWQVHGTDVLTPAQAWGIYERNARHGDLAALGQAERALVDALRVAFAHGEAAQ